MINESIAPPITILMYKMINIISKLLKNEKQIRYINTCTFEYDNNVQNNLSMADSMK